MLTTAFTSSAVCLNTLVFYKVNLHFFKVQSAKTMVSIVVLVGAGSAGRDGNNRSSHFSLASLTGSEKSQMRELGKWLSFINAIIYLY